MAEAPQNTGSTLEDRKVELYAAHPKAVATTILDGLKLQGGHLLHFEAGTSPDLVRWAAKAGLGYVAYDSRDTIAKLTENLRAPDIEVMGERRSILTANNQISSASFSIERFALAKLPFRQRIKAISSMMSLEGRGVCYMEYDWSSMFGSCQDQVFKDFALLSLQMFASLGWEPCFGGQLVEVVKYCSLSGVPDEAIKMQRHQRPRGQYVQELVTLCLLAAGPLEEVGHDALADSFDEVRWELESKPDLMFIPPEIVSVVVDHRPFRATL